MSDRKRAQAEDIEPGKWLWYVYQAPFAGVRDLSCPVRVEAIDGDEIHLKVFGHDFQLNNDRRGWALVVRFQDRPLFLIDPAEFEIHRAQELAWVESQKAFLDQYERELQAAAPQYT